MLTERQLKLIQAVIDRYIQTSEPVGSVEIVKNYNLKCSAATVRNEMAKLINLGFLDMLHSSSGRVPTGMAYRLYLEEIMEEEELPVLQEVAMKQRLWPNRFVFEKLLREAVLSLSENTKMLALATTSEGYITHAGAAHVLDHKEFWDIDAARAVLNVTDDFEALSKIFSVSPFGKEVKCVIEEEIGIKDLDKSAVVFAEYTSGNKSGHIAILGPSRLPYTNVVPAVRYTKKLLEELAESW